LAKSRKEEKPEEEITAPEVTQGDTAQDAQPDAAAEDTQGAQERYEELLTAAQDKYLRLAAEFDNYRKRSVKERESLYTDIRADAVSRFLPVYDSLSLAMKTECTDTAFRKGVEMTLIQLQSVFEDLGVSEIPALGERFDPERHNAVSHIENPDAGEQIITEEFQKGFTIGGKVIRFAMVQVSN
jgi:molecular chaperone GrpE